MGFHSSGSEQVGLLNQMAIRSIVTFGANLLNSLIQLGIADSGAHTRNGPDTCWVMRKQMRAMHWMVLPSPISSAKIALNPHSYMSYKYTLPHRHDELAYRPSACTINSCMQLRQLSLSSSIQGRQIHCQLQLE